MISIEQKIVTCSTELNPNCYHQQRLRRLLSHHFDRDRLIDLAIKEGLAGFLYKNVKKAGIPEDVDHKLRESLQPLYYRTVEYNIKLINELKKLLSILNQKRLQVVLLQGMALLWQIYDDIGLRPLTDIDLWVMPKDYPGLVSVLSSLGYRKDPLYPYTFRKGSTEFEIQTHIPWADRIKASGLLLGKSQENIFGHTRTLAVEGRQALCLGKYDQVLYLSLHALKHNMDRLIWLVDIKSLLAEWKEPDWQEFLNRARELGQEKIVSYIFFLLPHLVNFQIPLEVLKFMGSMRPQFLGEKVLKRMIKRDSLPLWVPLFLMSSGKGWPKRFPFLLENLFPRPEILRQVFADSFGSNILQLYGKRVFQIFGLIKGKRGIKKIVTSNE